MRVRVEWTGTPLISRLAGPGVLAVCVDGGPGPPGGAGELVASVLEGRRRPEELPPGEAAVFHASVYGGIQLLWPRGGTLVPVARVLLDSSVALHPAPGRRLTPTQALDLLAAAALGDPGPLTGLHLDHPEGHSIKGAGPGGLPIAPTCIRASAEER